MENSSALLVGEIFVFISHSTPARNFIMTFMCLAETARGGMISIFLFYILAHISSTKSLPTSNSSLLIEQRRSAMDAAMNYAHSYETPPASHLQRTGSSRQYAASLHRPPLNTSSSSSSSTGVMTMGRPSSIMSHEMERSPSRNLSRRVHSSTSLSSTGYDSNSSPSIKSNRNSIGTNNSTDFIAHSLSSSSSTTSSSSDELRRKSKPWVS